MPDTIPESLDLAGETCPMNYVRTKLRLERMESGALLDVLLDAGEGVTNVPRSARSDGHAVLAVDEESGRWRVRIQKG